MSIKGKHRFQTGTALPCSDPSLNDKDWKTILVPGFWSTQGVSNLASVGCYRIYFKAEPWLKTVEPAIYLGKIYNSDEIFLNGIKIGQEGSLNSNIVDARKAERLYKIPPDLINYNSDNLISIKVANFYLDGGIVADDIAIGDYNLLNVVKVNNEFNTKKKEIFFISVFFNFMVIFLFAYIKGLRSKDIKYLGIFIFLLIILYILNSLLFYSTGLKSHAVERIIIILSAITPLLLINFITNFFRYHSASLSKITNGYGLFLSALFSIPFIEGIKIFIFFNILWLIEIILAGFMIFQVMKKKYSTDRNEVIAIGICICFLLSSVILEFLVNLRFFSFNSSIMYEFSFITFLLSITYITICRHVRLRNNEFLLKQKMMNIQDFERKRLSMELHDGVGQNFLAIKLNLQILNRQLNLPFIDKLIDQVNDHIGHLRAISHGLNPTYLKENGLSYAIKHYSMCIAESLTIEMKLEICDLTVRLPEITATNLFRIFQEALNNAIKHSKATEIEIKLAQRDNIVLIQVKDNGKGFNFDRQNGGMGFQTMLERANIIGANINIHSKLQEGTTISVETKLE